MAVSGQEAASIFIEDDALLEEFEKRLKKNVDAYEKNLVANLDDLLDSLVLDEAGMVKTDVRNREVFNQVLNTIEQRLEDAGLGSMVQGVRNEMTERLESLNELVVKLGISNAVVDNLTELPLIQEHLEDFAQKISNSVPAVADDVTSSFMRYRNELEGGTAVRFERIRKTLITRAGVMPRYAGTLGNTELFATNRIGQDLQADKAGASRRVYTGVLDGLTRPFCANHVGLVKSRGAWASLYNDVGPQPVLFYCGGWNCRHHLRIYLDEWGSGKQFVSNQLA